MPGDHTSPAPAPERSPKNLGSLAKRTVSEQALRTAPDLLLIHRDYPPPARPCRRSRPPLTEC
jgi:hypothetical protein